MGKNVRGFPGEFLPSLPRPRMGFMQPAFIMVPIREDLVAEVCRWQSVQPPTSTLKNSSRSPSSPFNSSCESFESSPNREVKVSGDNSDRVAWCKAEVRRARNRERRQAWRNRRQAARKAAARSLSLSSASRSPVSGTESEDVSPVHSPPVAKLQPVVPETSSVSPGVDASVQVNLGAQCGCTDRIEIVSGDDHSPDFLAKDLVSRYRSHLRSTIPRQFAHLPFTTAEQFLAACGLELSSRVLPDDEISTKLKGVARRRISVAISKLSPGSQVLASDFDSRIDEVVNNVLSSSVVSAVIGGDSSVRWGSCSDVSG